VSNFDEFVDCDDDDNRDEAEGADDDVVNEYFDEFDEAAEETSQPIIQ
jgi:hypothetical protein